MSLLMDIKIDAKNITGDEKDAIANHIRNLQLPKVFTEDEIKIAKHTLEVCREKVPASGVRISTEEKLMVIKAMGFSQKGHWYKCRQGE